MKLLLLPNNSGAGLQELYHRALQESEELYILSAYLTEWDTTVKLGKQCKTFAFIVGKDFGITRKAACAKVIEWLPPTRRTHFLVAELIEGFHPKSIFWREADGSYHALAGSSNLSKAAFATNHEVNAYSKISRPEFETAKAWIQEIKKSCVMLGQSWLDGYVEAKRTGKPSGVGKPTPKSPDRVFNLRLPSKRAISASGSSLDFRRSQMLTFEKLKEDLVTHFENAATVQRRWWTPQKNEAFYHEFRRLWDFGDGSRFQANGWERRGKDSNFRELSISLMRVIDAEASDRDDVVMNEIDRLTKAKIATRRSVFTEMLCQFFPALYHLDNEPIRAWMKSTGCKSHSGATAGHRYLESALLLRAALYSAQNKKGGYPVENLGVLDALLWDVTRRSRALPSD